MILDHYLLISYDVLRRSPIKAHTFILNFSYVLAYLA